MKNRKKESKTYSSRKKNRDKAKRELLRIAEEINVGTRGAKVTFSYGSPSGRGRKNIYAEGVFSQSQSGYGFVKLGDDVRDIFIPESEIGNALDGDIVKISYHKYASFDGSERTEGRILEIIEQSKKTVIGTVDTDTMRIGRRRIERLCIFPDDGKIVRRIYIRNNIGAVPGDKVMARLIRTGTYVLEADVLSNFGKSDSREANYEAILAELKIDTEFTEEELRQAREESEAPISYEGRVIRDEVIFTIDSESAKDLDDAVSIAIDNDGNYVLGVHIADVSHYIKEKTVLDRLVMVRGTSIYFTDKVVPMLPVYLSNGACSLHPGEDKYALSAIMTIDKSGNILSTVLEQSVIRSRVKGIYDEINKIFSGSRSKKLLEKYSDCLDSLKLMKKLYKILAKKSEKRGAIELESPEAKIILDDSGAPVDIVRRERGDAERMIEQFMLAANESVATLLIEKDIPCVFRIHEAPPSDKLSDFLQYAANLGFNTSRIDPEKCLPHELAAICREAEERGIGEAVSYACLRSMSKAAYSEIHRPHFGLGIGNYCHFTSPIRRLSDLATHRIIHKVLFENKPKEKYRSYAKRAAAAATEGELSAIAAERRIENLYKVIYMSDHIGDIFPAVVNSVTTFGLFATAENTCEGLIPISELDGDYVFDEKNLTLRSFKEVIHIGDRILIRVEEADMLRGKLRYSLVRGEDNEGKN